jgi:ABC-type nitrate/sulfonate/bicarbonate transport system ATPase subunit
VTVLRVSGLHITRGGREVLAGVELELRVGEVITLVAPARAGKSTLLAALAGLVGPSAGTIERHGSVALAAQDVAFGRPTARGSLALALTRARVAPHEHAERIAAALTALDIATLADRPLAQLDLGMRRRVHIARALALRADAVLLDDPFAGLETSTRDALIADTLAAVRTGVIAVENPAGLKYPRSL